MACFPDNVYDEQPLDFHRLQNGATTLYTTRTALENDLVWFRERQYEIGTVDLDGIGTDVRRLHQRLAAALRFPDWYGHNLDALNDLLGHLDVPIESGRVIVLDSLEHVHRVDKNLPPKLCSIFQRASYRRLLFGRRLLFFLVSDDPSVSLTWTEEHSAEKHPPGWLSTEIDRTSPRSVVSKQAERRRHNSGR